MYWHVIVRLLGLVFIQHHRLPTCNTNFVPYWLMLSVWKFSTEQQTVHKKSWAENKTCMWVYLPLPVSFLVQSSPSYTKKLWRLAQSAMESRFRHARYVLASSPGNKGTRLGTYMPYLCTLIVQLHMHITAVMYWNYKLCSVLQHGLRSRNVIMEFRAFIFMMTREGGVFLLKKEGRQDCS